MAKHLRCKVLVALSIKVWILLMTQQAVAQSGKSIHLQNISISCQNLPLDKVIDRLSQKTGLHFIYSSSLVSLDTKITLNVHQEKLTEVLKQVGYKARLVFKVNGKYVIVKNAPADDLISRNAIARKEFSDPLVKEPLHSVPITIFREDERRAYFSALPENSAIARPSLTPLTNTHLLSTFKAEPIAPLKISRPFDLYRSRWFASLGLFANDFTYGGVELRAGLKPLYGVINTGLINNGLVRVGYGAGTAVNLSKRVTLNAIFTHATMHKMVNETFESPSGRRILEKAYLVQYRQNQVKLMAQYNTSSRFSIQAGVSFNQLKTSYAIEKILIEAPSLTDLPGAGQAGDTQFIQAHYSPAPVNIASGPLHQSFLRRKQETTGYWVGWEIGLYYRINFSSPR
jgi:hypothetical protein